jgi:hypothetical protein
LAKALALGTIYSDGTSAEDDVLRFFPTNNDTGKPFEEDEGVWVDIRPITQKVYDDCERRHTHKSKDNFARRLVEEVDARKLQDELIRNHVTNWSGLAARNAQTGAFELLPYREELKTALPPQMKAELIHFAMTARPVEIPAESFRRTA